MVGPSSTEPVDPSMPLEPSKEAIEKPEHKTSPINRSVTNLALSLQHSQETAVQGSPPKKNMVTGQVNGLYATTMLGDPQHQEKYKFSALSKYDLDCHKENSSFHSMVSSVSRLKQNSMHYTNPLLTPQLRETIHAQSTFAPQGQEKMGLFRAVGIDESKITNFDYNLSFTHEYLTLGTRLRGLFHQGKCPTIESIWTTCREWRFNRLDESTPQAEIDLFTSTRVGYKLFARTNIHSHNIRYGHLLPILVEQAKQVNAPTSASQNSIPVIRQKETTHETAGKVRLISFQHAMTIKKKRIALTEFRLVLNDQNKAIPHPWVHPKNSNSLLKDAKLIHPELTGKHEAIIIHTNIIHLRSLEQALQEKLLAYLSFLRKDLKGEFSKQPLRAPLFENTSDLQIISRLAEMHYLLAHAMLDGRGSSAKSELMIRSLAVAAGLELPPFKKGYVADLEAFLASHESFISTYPESFERT